MPESKRKEPRFEYTRGGLLVRYEYSTKLGENDEEINTYEEVLVSKKPTYGEVINAIIRNRYTVAAELSLINNMLKSDTSTEENIEYEDFQDYRDISKIISRAIVNGLDDLSWDELRSYAVNLDLSGSGTRAEIEARIEELD